VRGGGDAAEQFVGSYYRYQAAASCVFFSPVFFVYYQERVGLALGTILWIQAYFLAVRAVLDMPLGALADRYSRRACLAAYALGIVAGAAALLVSPTFATVVAAETVFAAAGAFKSGADSAFLYDGLKDLGRLDLYPRAESRAQAVMSLASGATAIAGGFLAARDLRLPYVATVVAGLVSAVLVRAFTPDHRAAGNDTAPRLMLGATRHALETPGVGWVIGLAAYTTVASHVYYYLQQPYLRAAGLSLALFGVVFAATKAVTAAVASRAHRIDESLGPRGVTVVMTVTPAVGLAAMAAATTPAGALLLLTRGVLDGLWQPLVNVYMNRLVGSRLRATMLSAQGLVARFALAATLALLGLATDEVGLARTLAAAALAVVVVGGALVVRGPGGALAPGSLTRR
jgi:MFS transporter